MWALYFNEASMNYLKIFVFSFISVMLPITLWSAIDVFVLNNCDHKFGCLGGFQFSLLIFGLCSFLSAIAFLPAYYLSLLKLHLDKVIYIHLLISAFILSFSSIGVLRIADSSIPNMVITWFFYSFIVGLATFYISKNITSLSCRRKKSG
jgi:hypothetical protein